MGKITLEMLAKSPSHTKKRRDETVQQYVRRLTHLYFSEKNIDEIDNLHHCRNLSVLYLYDNNIAKIKNLGFATSLTHLYLQKNEITKIEGLDNLRRLSKLYLGSNSITVVEGLEKLESLRELHIEKQNLPRGEKLLFEPRSLEALSKSLCVLNISENNMDSVEELRCLKNMTQFFTENNCLSDMKEFSRVLVSWPSLWRLELTGNPICNKKKYRDRVIVMSRSLVMLDGKEINETAKRFLMNWKASRDARRRQRKQLHFLEGGASNLTSDSSNVLSNIPSLPPILGLPSADEGYMINPGVNPFLYEGVVAGGPQSLALPRGTKPFAAIMQARAPNSTLLNRKPVEDVSQSRFPNIFAPPRPIISESNWDTDSDVHSGPPVSLQT
ncbi:protein phosphatase 1 regulatory subunit 42-like [Stylophora pistillata]|uniref:Protein phosphatase 1 regulatory subunit 42 n=1 Tax=Stylophora pistillata TaxID=50429 RepID=A0A2B4SFN6_STYPI|nr:protein phosphatase 1 regulatory subunit 42-like [Stylophora pistillata]PFX27342.1 Protein phosphatase 1 regulatory subunit 42 [Stylophora pistillata]